MPANLLTLIVLARGVLTSHVSVETSKGGRVVGVQQQQQQQHNADGEQMASRWHHASVRAPTIVERGTAMRCGVRLYAHIACSTRVRRANRQKMRRRVLVSRVISGGERNPHCIRAITPPAPRGAHRAQGRILARVFSGHTGAGGGSRLDDSKLVTSESMENKYTIV